MSEFSPESVLALMPHKRLTKIDGEPTHRNLKTAEKELAENLISVPCPWGLGKGHLGILQDPGLFFQRNGANFEIPASAPPAYPVIPAGATVVEREQLKATNKAARLAYETYKCVQRYGVNMLAECIDEDFYAKIDDPDEGLNGITIRDFIDHIRSRYAQIDQTLIDENLAEFEKGIDSNLPLAVYTRKQEKCQVFAAAAGVPISEATMVTTGTKHALQCGGMTQAWRDWKRRATHDKTWNNWKQTGRRHSTKPAI